MRTYSTVQRTRRWFVFDRIPVTKVLIVANVLTFLLVAFFKLNSLSDLLVFNSISVFIKPWTLVTYPLFGFSYGPISLLFACYWLWIAGGSLERSWGSQRYAGFFSIITAITAVGLLIGGFFIGKPVGLTGLWMPLAAVTVAFAMLNPEEKILFFFIIPLKLKYLALIDVVLVLLSYGSINPLLGLFALLGCAAAYLYVTRRVFINIGGRRKFGNVIDVSRRTSARRSKNPFKRMKDKKEEKRLRDFLEIDDE